MKAIIKYLANDGSEFSTEAAALKHDSLCAKVLEIESSLPKNPLGGCEFENGRGYLQWTEDQYELVKRSALTLMENGQPKTTFRFIEYGRG